MNRPNENTLIVTAEGDDRRKLPRVHSLSLPENKVENVLSSADLSKKFLRINDTTLPLDFILKSVGKGNNIKIKIIDKPSHAKPEAIANVGNIVELIDTEKQDLKGTGLPPNQCDNVTNVTSEAGFKGEMFNLFFNNYFKGV